MAKIIIIAVIFGLILFIFSIILKLVGSNICQRCDGEGYWKETRGERNFCKECNGTGQRISNKNKKV